MKKVSPKRFSEFVEVALRAGATAARIIPSNRVVIDERVRFKCEVPRCAGYGQYLTEKRSGVGSRNGELH
jgi:predicted metal-binding protein